MSPFEIIMLACFGFAWPFSIHKSFKSRQNNGKSLAFLYIVALGYVSGIIHKFLYNYDAVIFLYCANFLMVVADISLFYRNLRLEIMNGTLKANCLY